MEDSLESKNGMVLFSTLGSTEGNDSDMDTDTSCGDNIMTDITPKDQIVDVEDWIDSQLKKGTSIERSDVVIKVTDNVIIERVLSIDNEVPISIREEIVESKSHVDKPYHSKRDNQKKHNIQSERVESDEEVFFEDNRKPSLSTPTSVNDTLVQESSQTMLEKCPSKENTENEYSPNSQQKESPIRTDGETTPSNNVVINNNITFEYTVRNSHEATFSMTPPVDSSYKGNKTTFKIKNLIHISYSKALVLRKLLQKLNKEGHP